MTLAKPASEGTARYWASDAPRVYHLAPRDALTACRELAYSDPCPFDDDRLALAAMGLPPLADDDAPEVTR